MAELGLGAYRFSVSWPRVLPTGLGPANERGLDFYERLVDALLEAGIRPCVTLYHWDLPEALQDAGGWGTREAVEAFGKYAAAVVARLGDRVRDWITLNEPGVVAFVGHAEGRHAPGVRDWEVAVRVAHHLLLAHRAGARAVRSAAPGSRVGIALDLSPCHPTSDSRADVDAAVRMDAHLNRRFLDPLFGRGYPSDVAGRRPLFPEALRDELDGFHGDLDLLGVNYYRRHVVRASRDQPLGAAAAERPGVERTATGWEVYPDGLHELLVRLADEYAPPALAITENGAAYDDTPDGEDPARVDFLARHLDAAARALEAGVPLEGYFVWSLLDNFEWAEGFSKRFGIVYVDYETQRRTPKTSARWYSDLIRAWDASRP